MVVLSLIPSERTDMPTLCSLAAASDHWTGAATPGTAITPSTAFAERAGMLRRVMLGASLNTEAMLGTSPQVAHVHRRHCSGCA